MREYFRKGKEQTMAKMTRRAMLWATSASVAAAAGVTALVAGEKVRSVDAAPAHSEIAAGASVTAYIANVSSGKISIISGDNEFVITNPALVQEIVNAAR